MIGVAVSLAAILLYGAVEAGFNRQTLKRIPLRIQVNGIRGKSTVTRLIYGALRANGVRVMAKTTGTEARVLLPDGTERPIRRWGPPNIRETLWFMREAQRQGATAVVVECMAVKPELQWTVEHRMVHSTHGVITNVRHDHLEAMGLTLPEIAASLGNTIPAGGVLITGDAAFVEYYRTRAEALGTTVVLATPDETRAGRTIPRDRNGYARMRQSPSLW
jgi:poly-gamma-glutamate synthase PgsB/CapB